MSDSGGGQTRYDDNDLIALIQFHSIDIIIGSISSAICALTLLVFISSKQFFLQNKLLTLLAIADLFTSFGVLALGLMRKRLYTAVMETSRVPVENSWTCSGKPFVYLRLLGALIPPGIVLWISIERFLAVYSAQFYRRHITRHSNVPPLLILIYTLFAIFIAYSIAWANRKRGTVEAYCGRKNAFTKGYTTYVYVADVLGFAVALLINCITLCRLGRLYAQRQNRLEVKKQLRRINYLIVISVISTITVAIPNGISLISAWIGRLNIALSDPANWMIAAKCSVNLFIYLLLKPDFRQRVYEILGCLSVDQFDNKDRGYDISGVTGAMGLGQQLNAANINKEQSRRIGDARESITALGDFGTRIAGARPQPPRASLAVPNSSRSEQKQKRKRRESVRLAWTTSSQMHIDRAN